MITDGVLADRAFLPLLLAGERVIREGDLAGVDNEGGRDGLKRSLRQAEGRLGDFEPLSTGDIGLVSRDARGGVRVGATADRDQRGRPGKEPFEMLAGIAGPIARDAVVGEGHGVAGVRDVHAADGTVGVADEQQGEIVIDRTARSAAVASEARATNGPLEAGGLPLGEGVAGGFSGEAEKLLGVVVDVALVVGGNGDTEEGGADIGEHGGGVRVSTQHRETLWGEATGLLNPAGEVLDQLIRDGHGVEGEEDDGGL